MSRWIYGIDELSKEEYALVGKKCANLGELARAGFRVPQGFALAVTAYEKFFYNTGIVEEIKKLCQKFNVDPDNPADVTKFKDLSMVIRKIIEDKEFPDDMGDAIVKKYEDMCPLGSEYVLPVAVRSAGPASHPGQYETYLFVSGKSDVLENIKKVWSSTFNGRSMVARSRLGILLHYDPIGVAVIGMVKAKAAGVMFTANPVNGDLSKIMIEASLGLGESVVSGSVDPDRYMIDKVTFEIIESKVSTKLVQYAVDRENGKPRFFDIPKEKQNIPSLNEEEMLEIARIGKKIEKHFGSPQDIEWAVDMDLPFPENIFLLQTRNANIKEEKIAKQVFETGKTALDLIQDIARLGKL